ncbi:acyl-protein synthetase [Aliiglaciecola sp.]|nr:acyl-protein synthetase [Aliiglaciecola sp.]
MISLMTRPDMENYLTQFESLLQHDVYGLLQEQKEQILCNILDALHKHHEQHCEAYGRIVNDENDSFNMLSDFPYLAVRLFKQLDLRSIDKQDVYRVLQSSGTTSQQPARVYLDKVTSARQSKVLVKILQDSIGKQRLPMLIIDSPSVLKDKAKFSARGAGIQGLSFFGRDHTYALDDNMQPNWPVIDAFHDKYAGQPVLMFGFTYMVWLYFVQQLSSSQRTLHFDKGILLHSGGWKKLEQAKVDNDSFKATLLKTTGISRCFNFYGMAEQVGSVFVECAHGHLHAPVFADVIVRDPFTLACSPNGELGLLQVLSAVPSSYPGHSILTEDLGTLLGVDDCPCGRKGKYFSVQGRLPKTEVRGCSDTHKG